MNFWKKIFGKRGLTSSRAHAGREASVQRQMASIDVPKQSYASINPSGYVRGKDFERSVQELLYGVQGSFSLRVKVTPQERVKLLDGRFKIIDFGFEYRLASSRHQIAIECQDRESWSTEILDKILAIRNHSYRNRFWFVYHDDSFLSEEAQSLLKRHGILYFSLSALRRHLDAVRRDLSAVEAAEKIDLQGWLENNPEVRKWMKKNDPRDPDYEPPGDSYMLSR